MSDWSDLSLPVGQVQGYGYGIMAGLLRTPFDAPQPRQKRTNTTDRKEVQVSFLLTFDQLVEAEAFLQSYVDEEVQGVMVRRPQGYYWFTMDLLDGNVDGSPVSTHLVRLNSDYTVSAVGYNLYQLSCSLDALPAPQDAPACIDRWEPAAVEGCSSLLVQRTANGWEYDGNCAPCIAGDLRGISALFGVSFTPAWTLSFTIEPVGLCGAEDYNAIRIETSDGYFYVYWDGTNLTLEEPYPSVPFPETQQLIVVPVSAGGSAVSVEAIFGLAGDGDRPWVISGISCTEVQQPCLWVSADPTQVTYDTGYDMWAYHNFGSYSSSLLITPTVNSNGSFWWINQKFPEIIVQLRMGAVGLYGTDLTVIKVLDDNGDLLGSADVSSLPNDLSLQTVTITLDWGTGGDSIGWIATENYLYLEDAPDFYLSVCTNDPGGV
jgi:hypothetical protein